MEGNYDEKRTVITVHIGAAIQSLADFIERTANKETATDKELETLPAAATALARLIDSWRND